MSKCVAAGRHHSEAKGISMFIIYIIVTIVTVAANVFAAVVDFRHPHWVVDIITRLGGSLSWLFTLCLLKATGASGLMICIGVHLVGVAAATGLDLCFL